MGKKPDDLTFIDDDGLRVDGREKDELRPIDLEAGVLKRPDGSAYLEWGGNKVLAATYGPREMHPRHLMDPTKATVRVRYNMAAFSVSDRARPGPSRRAKEISKVSSEAFEPVVLTHEFPGTAIDVFVEIIEAEAGTRCAGITAASVAMADAGIPMKDLVASCAAGKVEDEIVLDVNREEDNFGQTDLPIALSPKTGEVQLLQMDGHFTDDELDQAVDLAVDACEDIYEKQKEALLGRWDAASNGGGD